jgi:hypothetical protein
LFSFYLGEREEDMEGEKKDKQQATVNFKKNILVSRNIMMVVLLRWYWYYWYELHSEKSLCCLAPKFSRM